MQRSFAPQVAYPQTFNKKFSNDDQFVCQHKNITTRTTRKGPNTGRNYLSCMDCYKFLAFTDEEDTPDAAEAPETPFKKFKSTMTTKDTTGENPWNVFCIELDKLARNVHILEMKLDRLTAMIEEKNGSQ